jgi:type IV pilus assembly protein PilC
MADMLLRIADIYEKKAEEAAAKLPVVLEPILLVFIGGLVGTIAFAIIVPIYSVVGSMGNA